MTPFLKQAAEKQIILFLRDRMLLSLPNLSNSIKHENKIQVLFYHVFMKGLHLYLFNESGFHFVSVYEDKNGKQIYQCQETFILYAL